MNPERTNNQFLMSIDKAKVYFDVGGNKLREMIKTEPDIPVLKIGSIVKIIVPEFEKWLIQAAEEGRNL